MLLIDVHNLVYDNKNNFWFRSNYTEEEFSREFLEDESDVDKLYENDVRKIPNYDILEGEVKSVEVKTFSSYC